MEGGRERGGERGRGGCDTTQSSCYIVYLLYHKFKSNSQMVHITPLPRHTPPLTSCSDPTPPWSAHSASLITNRRLHFSSQTAVHRVPVRQTTCSRRRRTPHSAWPGGHTTGPPQCDSTGEGRWAGFGDAIDQVRSGGVCAQSTHDCLQNCRNQQLTR